MEARSKGNEIEKTAVRLIIITIASMLMGALMEMAGRGNVWGIIGIVGAVAVIAATLFAGALQRRGREYVRR